MSAVRSCFDYAGPAQGTRASDRVPELSCRGARCRPWSGRTPLGVVPIHAGAPIADGPRPTQRADSLWVRRGVGLGFRQFMDEGFAWQESQGSADRFGDPLHIRRRLRRKPEHQFQERR